MRRLSSTWLLLLMLTNCGVEAGNPGDKPKTGSLNIHIAREPVVGSESLSLDLASLEIISDGVITSLAPAVASVDLFGLTENDDALVATSASVPAGSYAQWCV